MPLSLLHQRFQVPAGQLLLLVFWSQLERLKHESSSSTCQEHKDPLQVRCYLFKHCFRGQPPSRKGETHLEKRYTASVSNVKEYLCTNHTRRMCCLLNEISVSIVDYLIFCSRRPKADSFGQLGKLLPLSSYLIFSSDIPTYCHLNIVIFFITVSLLYQYYIYKPED